MNYYTVYQNETLIASGITKECAKQMGRSKASFYSMLTKTRCGKHNKYTVIIEKNEDDADFEQVEVIGKVK